MPLVEGLKENLISISQLCDQDLFINFTKEECREFDKSENRVMTGSRSSDNSYMLQHSLTCHKTSVNDIDL